MRLAAYFVPPEIQQATEAKQRFLEWVQKKYPEIWQQATADFVGLGDIPPSNQPTLIDQIGNNILKVATAVAQYRGQRDLIKLNLTRAQQGLDPVDSGAVAMQANVGISKDVKKIAYVGIGALLLTVFFLSRRRR